MTKTQVANRLSETFEMVAIQGWLSKFPDNHVFDPTTFCNEFIDYINSLPPIPRHPEE